jgi:hypothetical protein
MDTGPAASPSASETSAAAVPQAMRGGSDASVCEGGALYGAAQSPTCEVSDGADDATDASPDQPK